MDILDFHPRVHIVVCISWLIYIYKWKQNNQRNSLIFISKKPLFQKRVHIACLI